MTINKKIEETEKILKELKLKKAEEENKKDYIFTENYYAWLVWLLVVLSCSVAGVLMVLALLAV